MDANDDGVYELFMEGRQHLADGEFLRAIPPLEAARDRAPDKGSIREALGGLPDDTRNVAASVDDGVPLSVGERIQTPIPVAKDLVGPGNNARPLAAAVKERNLVSAGHRRLGKVAAKEDGAADDENVH